MRRFISVILIMILALSMTVVNAQSDTMVIGVATKAAGYFLSDQWQPNGTDSEIRYLLHGAATSEWVSQSHCQINQSVVAKHQLLQEESGQSTVFVLQDGLMWSDGSPITAADYVFSVLLQASPVLREFGAKPAYEHIAGYDAYQNGGVFSGVKMLDEKTFSLTVDSKYLPNFYEDVYKRVQPLPIDYIAPGLRVYDNGEGAFLSAALSKELLETTLFDTVYGYMSHPKVSAGAYMLESFDTASGEAVLRRNPYFIGDVHGAKPNIEVVKIVLASGEEGLGALEKGEIDVLAKQVSGKIIRKAQKAKQLQTSMYLRKGYGFIGFDLNDAITGNVNIRQAISHSISKVKFAEALTQGYGGAVTGEYGFGLWLAKELAKVPDTMKLPDQDVFNAYQNLEIKKTDYSFAQAKELLRAEGFMLGKDGRSYDKHENARYRKTANGMEELAIKMMVAEHSEAGVYAEKIIAPALRGAGFSVKTEKVPFDVLISEYENPSGRANLFLLGSDFSEPYNPLASKWLTADFDAQLYQFALDMQATNADDTSLYAEKWLKYQNRFVDLLPTIPLYSGVMADICSEKVLNYSGLSGFARAILTAKLK